MLTPKVEKLLAHLRASREFHIQLGKYAFTVDDGNLYPLDLLTNAVLNRSLALIEGFSVLIERRNFVAAAPLLRLQIDNALRYYAAWIVPNPHEFCVNILKEIPVRNQKDKSGKKMTDAYLVEQLGKEAPWLKSVYNNTSGYIHLSEKHLFVSAREKKLAKADLNLVISGIDEFPSDELYVEAIEAFVAATDLLLRYVHGWGATKEKAGAKSKEREL